MRKKYGSDIEEDDLTGSSTSETEDEEGEELTPAASAALLRTLARIQNKDPEIYNSATAIYAGQSLAVLSVHMQPANVFKLRYRGRTTGHPELQDGPEGTEGKGETSRALLITVLSLT